MCWAFKIIQATQAIRQKKVMSSEVKATMLQYHVNVSRKLKRALQETRDEANPSVGELIHQLSN